MKKEKPVAHHGKGVRHARKVLNVSSSKLAHDMDLPEEKLIEMEEQAKWTDENLQKAAAAMSLETKWLIGTHPYNTEYPEGSTTVINNENTFNDESAMVKGKDSVTGINSGEITNNYQTVDKLVDMFYKMLHEQQDAIAQLRKEIDELKKK